MKLTLTPDQQRAEAEILEASAELGSRYLLTGSAGTGKSTLVRKLARAWKKRKQRLALTAPTHKAVAVLRRMVRQEGLGDDVECRTIQSLLSLKPQVHGDRQVFVRDKHAKPVEADIVVCDEASMNSADLMRHIRRYMPVSFVLFVGDPAQLPPVNERESEAFQTKARSHLETIVRQAAGNPILEAATIIRENQGKPFDWSWACSRKAEKAGVFVPADPWDWMKQGFTRKAFDDNPDTFRFLAWRNDRVAQVNDMVRAWRYGGPPPTPFMPGEFAMFRSPLTIAGNIIFGTNEEARVVSIKPSTHKHWFESTSEHEAWTAEIPTWEIRMRRADGSDTDVHMPADANAMRKVEERIRDEASYARVRWRHLYDWKGGLAHLQSIYAMTVHTSQGSTFENAFVDVRDIAGRLDSNLLEAQQMFYVAATRPTTRLILVNP